MKAAIPQTKKITLPNVSERRQVHILNPKSGSQKYCEAARAAIAKTGGEILESTRAGEITELVAGLFSRDPFAHAVVYGGDGTVYETVNGIMQSGHNATASFSVVPAGSGNDFSAYVNDSGVFRKAELNRIDLIRTTVGGQVRYSANVTNMGFDCDVVRETYKFKRIPVLRGPAAYIAGVVTTLIRKKAISGKITMSGCADRDGNPLLESVQSWDQKILLTACANAQFYGGGFHAAPIASVSDGLMDVLVVRDVSRLRFVSLVKYYRDGTFIGEDGELLDKFKKVLDYRKCKKIVIDGPQWYCMDGEVLPTNGAPVEAEAVPGAVWYAAL
ncbi:MAG: hypothetical protein IJC71_05540 [Clostridia bacterium]|nr:hypothetical protein [Clostridia bacterium]